MMDEAMIGRLLVILTTGTALGCGLIAGTFFAFSAFVMKALARLPSAQGMAAMQSINVVVINPLFLGVFVGTAVGCLLLAVAALLTWQKPGAGCLFLGSLLYLLGTFLVTMVFNVPRNDALAAIDPASVEGPKLWIGYISSWTAWNHVRTLAALAAAGSLMVALWLSPGRGGA